MKYVVILGDGMADRPIEELGGMTPLEYAKTPMMDALAEVSEVGMVKTVPDDMKPGSDVANLAVLGYDPRANYSGRSPLEALSIGIDMKDTDIAMRVNVVTLEEPEGAAGDVAFEDLIITDHSSGEISTEDAAILLDALRADLENEEFQFYVGTSYRHCCIWNHGKVLDFAMNDKCAAGTGRFLQVMATALGMDVSELGDNEDAEQTQTINSMCTVFAESEIIGLLAQGLSPEGIIAGLHQSVGKRVGAMARRLGIKERVGFTGGVAINAGVKRALEEELGCQLLIPSGCQFTGALGAALLACNR